MKKQINGVAPLAVLTGHDADRSEVAVPEAMKDAIRPDPEVVVRAHRRQFTAEYKKRILAEADSAHEPGAIGAPHSTGGSLLVASFGAFEKWPRLLSQTDPWACS